jgi:hypothetical protein
VAAATPKTHKRAAVAEGSLAHRVLEIVRSAGAPIAKAKLVAGAGAREIDVMLTVKALVAQGRLQQLGRRAGTTYALSKGGAK